MKKHNKAWMGNRSLAPQLRFSGFPVARCHHFDVAMNAIRRLSRSEASEKATALARRLAETTDMKGWGWELGLATPDPINTETIGKTPRHWITLIRYSKDGSILDGPGVIHVDLQSEIASWEETL